MIPRYMQALLWKAMTKIEYLRGDWIYVLDERCNDYCCKNCR